MFDVGASELLLIVIVAIVVIGPKDLPLALRTAGRWIGKMRRISGHFRSGIETMIREAELEEMERKWREQNEKIMSQHPNAEPSASVSAEAGATGQSGALGQDGVQPNSVEARSEDASPQLPLPPR